jgi:hypothetical protein
MQPSHQTVLVFSASAVAGLRRAASDPVQKQDQSDIPLATGAPSVAIGAIPGHGPTASFVGGNADARILLVHISAQRSKPLRKLFCAFCI